MAQIIQPSTVPCLTVGGRVFTDLSNLIILTTYVTGTSTYISTLRRANGSAGYQITAGKTLTIYAAQMHIIVASSVNIGLGYGDNDVGQLTTTVPTNPVYVAGAAGVGIFSLAAIGFFEASTNFQIPATKYGFVNAQATAGAGTIRLYGYEA